MYVYPTKHRQKKNMNNSGHVLIGAPWSKKCRWLALQSSKWSLKWVKKKNYSLPLFETLHWLNLCKQNKIPVGSLHGQRAARGEGCLSLNHIWQLSPPSPICSSHSGHPFLPYAKVFSIHSVLHMLPGIPMTTATSHGRLLFFDIFTLNVLPWKDFPGLPNQQEIPFTFSVSVPY